MIPFLTTLFTNKPSTEGTTRNEKKPLDTADSKTASQSSKIKKEAPAESTPLSKRQATVQKDQARVTPQKWQQTVVTHTPHPYLKQASTALPNRQGQTQTIQTRAATPEEQLQYQKDLEKFDEERLKNLASNLLESHKTFQSCYKGIIENLSYYKSSFEKNKYDLKERRFLINELDMMLKKLIKLKAETDIYIKNIDGKIIDASFKQKVEEGQISPQKNQKLKATIHKSSLIQNASKFEEKACPIITITEDILACISLASYSNENILLDPSSKKIYDNVKENLQNLEECREKVINGFNDHEKNLKDGYFFIEEILNSNIEEKVLKEWNIRLMSRKELIVEIDKYEAQQK